MPFNNHNSIHHLFFFLLLIVPLKVTNSQAAPSLPSPEDKTHEPILGYPSTGAPNWWSKLYLPQDSGGSSKVPMPDGLLIAQSQALRTSHKVIPWDDAETLQSPDTDNAVGKEVPFKPGTDEEYLAARSEGTTSSLVLGSESDEKTGDLQEHNEAETAAASKEMESELESDPATKAALKNRLIKSEGR